MKGPQASLIAQLVKYLPAKRETWVWSLGWEDPLEKRKATTPVFWPREVHGLESMGSQRVGCDFHFHFSFFSKEHHIVQLFLNMTAY